MSGGFYVIDGSKTVKSVACLSERQAKREALVILGKMRSDAVDRLTDRHVDQMFQSLVRRGLVSVQWSAIRQIAGAKFKANLG